MPFANGSLTGRSRSTHWHRADSAASTVNTYRRTATRNGRHPNRGQHAPRCRQRRPVGTARTHTVPPPLVRPEVALDTAASAPRSSCQPRNSADRAIVQEAETLAHRLFRDERRWGEWCDPSQRVLDFISDLKKGDDGGGHFSKMENRLTVRDPALGEA